MAELRLIEVRCVNTLLAQIKVGERGQHFIVEVPVGNFDPSEFEKLIEGVKAAKIIGNEQHSKLKGKTQISIETTRAPSDAMIIKKAVTERLGIPMIILDWELYDPRYYGYQQLRTRIETFAEMLRMAKVSL